MSLLPRVTEKGRELVAREFDDRGPDACMREIVEHLKGHNPELLDMAARCAGDLWNSVPTGPGLERVCDRREG
jgi:hypothetical protein